MNLQELKFKTRKHWLWLNLVVAVLMVVLIIIFDRYDINPFWELLVYIPLIFLGFGTDMVLTRQEIKKVGIFFFFLLYIIISWLQYEKSHSIFTFFSLETVTNFAYAVAFFVIPVLLFGYLPYKLLRWKDRKIINTGTYSFREAAYFIYRQLTEDIAKKTSTEEVGELLKIAFGLEYPQLPESFVEVDENTEPKIEAVLKAYPHFSREDIDAIMILNKKYIDEK